jgi:asparagine synthase (glutamine-hydrolysing)
MPGIVGIISREPPDVCRRRLVAMRDSMLHESCYVSATVDAPEMGAYAGWVAHPDSFAAVESGTDGTGAINLAFAGECFQESSGSPGSLLRLYDRLGDNWVSELNGLFSGVIIDRQRGRAFLFNDRYGMERVYVHETEHSTYFASEAKALLRVAPATRSFDDEGVAQFLTFGCPLNGRTLFRGVRMLEGGSLWSFDEGSCSKRRYFTPPDWERQPPLSADDFQTAFEHSFKRALPRYLTGPSRIGISATGGLDTRMIMACLPELPTPPICYTFAGVQGLTLDARLAARVASECGFEHRLLRVGTDFLSDYPAHLDRTVYVTDGSAGAVSTHEMYLHRQARCLAPVRLTGNFGSEVLRSASTLKNIGLSRELLAPDFRARVDTSASDVPGRGTHPITFAAFQEVPWSLFGLVASAKSQLTFRTPYLDNDLVGLAYRAPSIVRQSTTSAVRLVQGARPRLAAIPTDRAVLAGDRNAAYLIKRALAEIAFKLDYMHKEDPPRGLGQFLAVLDRMRLLGLHKWLPYRLWFQKELAPFVTDTLTDPATVELPFWNRPALSKVAHDHVKGTRNYVREINAVLTLATVDRLLMGSSEELC